MPNVKISVAEQMLCSATRLQIFRAGMPRSTGTGFYYAVEIDSGSAIHLLVTNKHVLGDGDHAAITMHVGEPPDGETIPASFRTFFIQLAGKRLDHPDPAVDLAAVMLGPTINGAIAEGTPPFYVTLTQNVIPSSDQWSKFDALEQVTMIGCPRGLFDESNNLPIARRGSTASHPAKKFQGKDEFLVDLACFPGSSGSPVFLHDRGGWFDRVENSFNIGGGRVLLLGVLYAGPTILNTGEIVLAHQPSFNVATTMHLGQVIRSSALQEFDRYITKSVQKRDIIPETRQTSAE